MLDLTPANQHLAPVDLDPNNGQVIGSPPANVASAPPTTTTSPPPTTTASTTTNITPPPTTTTTTKKPPPKPAPFKPKLSFSTKKTSKSLKLSFRVTGLSTSKGKITVSAKLTLGKKTIASGKGTVHSGRVTLTLKSKKKLKRGTDQAVDDGQPGRQVGEVLQDPAPALSARSRRSKTRTVRALRAARNTA